MRESEKHHDGTNPEEPLAPEHFSPGERREAEQLGDGSPGVAPRTGVGPDGELDVGERQATREPEGAGGAP
ncbi:MAG: hypothetical protein ACREON_10775 [Gemmatimonadaceae bacterium]